MLDEGDRAPDFSLESDKGETVRLGDFRGKTVVLYFYPKDDTPGCTREAQAFSGAIDAFAQAGAVVLGVSRDSAARHGKFRDKYGLRVTLLSDPDLTAHEAYGAYGEKTMYGKKVMGAIRSTFVVGGDGVIKRAYRSVKVDGHAEEVLALVGGAAAAAPSPKAKKAAATPAVKEGANPGVKASVRASAKPAAPIAAKSTKPAAKSAAKHDGKPRSGGR